MTYKNAYTSEINILEQEETFGFIWPIGFQTVLCGPLCTEVPRGCQDSEEAESKQVSRFLTLLQTE